MRHTPPRRDQSGGAYRNLRARVFREEDICCICGKPVDKSLPGAHPMGPTLEHTTPWSRGGTNTRDNVHLAHRSCNIRKGNGTNARVTPPIPTSRDW